MAADFWIRKFNVLGITSQKWDLWGLGWNLVRGSDLGSSGIPLWDAQLGIDHVLKEAHLVLQAYVPTPSNARKKQHSCLDFFSLLSWLDVKDPELRSTSLQSTGHWWHRAWGLSWGHPRPAPQFLDLFWEPPSHLGSHHVRRAVKPHRTSLTIHFTTPVFFLYETVSLELGKSGQSTDQILKPSFVGIWFIRVKPCPMFFAHAIVCYSLA